MDAFPNAVSKVELGYVDNKTIPIASIAGLDIRLFRSFQGQSVALGKHLTVFSGRNGSMKTSLLGLIAHPFDSVARDAFGKTLKTTLKEVFRLSPLYDNQKYEYDLIIDTGADSLLREPVSIYYVDENTQRHRVVVSGAEKGDGNFIYNTSFLNLKRLYPLVDTRAAPDLDQSLTLSQQEAAELKDFYETIFPSTEYAEFTPVHQKNLKTTFAPSGDEAKYDWNSISSGEDNLGSIFNRLVGFQRAYVKGQETGNGILCIDEFESSLHPVAQLRLLEYLYRWARQHKVQVVISTHSLYLISHIYLKHAANLAADRVVVNFISKAGAQENNFPILKNPSYELAYKQLTFLDPVKAAQSRKIRVFCEDEFAVHFAKRLIKSLNVLKALEFHSSFERFPEKTGTSYSALKSVCVQFPMLLEGSLVLFDADVDEKITRKIKDKNIFLCLPDPDNLAIERRIIVFISELSNNDSFFAKFDKEREIFLDEFKQAGIKSLTSKDIKDENTTPILVCKRWADDNKSAFKQYITYYCNTVVERTDFVEKFLRLMNQVNAAQGIPSIKI